MLLREKTVPYRSWIKESVVNGLSSVFNDHVDDLLRETKVTIEFPTSENRYPAIIVRFYERNIDTMGVGHSEILEVDGADHKFLHYMYKGDLEFAIHTLSSVDRDLIADSLVQTIGMGRLTDYTERFYNRIYPTEEELPKARYNYLNINTDRIQGFGDTQNIAPWLPEDTLVYQAGYRCEAMGEFYSLPPESGGIDYIENVNVYPYIEDLEPVPEGADDPAPWIDFSSA